MRHQRWLTMAVVLSVLLFLTVAVLWVRSYWVEEHGWANLAGGRYTVRVWQGRLTLWGPPAMHSPAFEKQTTQLVAELRNDQIGWSAPVFVGEHGVLALEQQRISPRAGTPAAKLLALWPNPASRALDDPRKIGAAHVLLLRAAASFALMGWNPRMRLALFARLRASGAVAAAGPAPLVRLKIPKALAFSGATAIHVDPSRHLPPHALMLDCNGLRVALWPDGAVANYARYPARLSDGKDDEIGPFRLDPASFAAVRDSWHRQLDSRIVSIPLWLIAALALFLPLYRGIKFFRSRRALRRGLCPSCGYDLRASPVRCPECGYVIPARTRRTMGTGQGPLNGHSSFLRPVFTFLSALSLLLLAVILIFWISAGGGTASVHWARAGGRFYWAGCANGRLFLNLAKPWPCDEPLHWSGPRDTRIPRMIFGTTAGPLPKSGAYAVHNMAVVPVTADGRTSWAPPGPWGDFISVDELTSTWDMYAVPAWIPTAMTAFLPLIWAMIWLLDFIERPHRRFVERELG